jgi:hypothetical protein
LALAWLVGCGASGPTTYPVSGKVTIDGEPAKEVRVDFYPVDSTNQMASGQVSENGTYTLFTGQIGKEGAMAGKYKVVLAPLTTDTSYMDSGTDPTTQPQEGAVPEEYTKESTTPKEVEVKPGPNSIDIEI